MRSALLSALIFLAVAGGLLGPSTGTSAASESLPTQQQAVQALFETIQRELSAPEDQAALADLRDVFTEHGTLAHPQTPMWILLRFDRQANLVRVKVNAERLLNAPPLLQRAIVLHELEHLRWAKDVRRLVNTPPWASRTTPHHVSPLEGERARVRGLYTGWVGGDKKEGGDQKEGGDSDAAYRRYVARLLLEDEMRAYRREFLSVAEALHGHGGLAAYLETLPAVQRGLMGEYARRSLEPFLTTDGRVAEGRLRQTLASLSSAPTRPVPTRVVGAPRSLQRASDALSIQGSLALISWNGTRAARSSWGQTPKQR